MCSVNLPALACLKVCFLIFCFNLLHILDQNDVLIVLMIIYRCQQLLRTVSEMEGTCQVGICLFYLACLFRHSGMNPSDFESSGF